VVSLAFHVAIGLYLFAHHFTLQSPPRQPDPSVITIETIRPPPPQPPSPSPHAKKRSAHRQAHEPIHIHQAAAIIGLTPGPALEIPSGPPGAGGDGLSQTIAAPVILPAPPKPRPKTIQNPDWIHKPSGEQLADAYPHRALIIGQAGSATLLCTVGIDGSVRECSVAAETPKDAGFGAAALKLSRWFRVRPQTENGQAVDGALVRVPIQFGVR
jgi:protein TonB